MLSITDGSEQVFVGVIIERGAAAPGREVLWSWTLGDVIGVGDRPERSPVRHLVAEDRLLVAQQRELVMKDAFSPAVQVVEIDVGKLHKGVLCRSWLHVLNRFGLGSTRAERVILRTD